MLVVKIGHIRNGLQILTDELAKDACSCTMKDAHARHAHEYCVINEISDGIDGVVSAHSPHVKVLLEIEFPVVDGLACHLTSYVDGCGVVSGLGSLCAF